MENLFPDQRENLNSKQGALRPGWSFKRVACKSWSNYVAGTRRDVFVVRVAALLFHGPCILIIHGLHGGRLRSPANLVASGLVSCHLFAAQQTVLSVALRFNPRNELVSDKLLV